MLVALQVYDPIEKMKKNLQASIRKGDDFDTELLFLIDGSYHLLWTVSYVCILKGIDYNDPGQALLELDTAIAIVKRAVATEAEKDAAFAHKKYFKSTRPKKAIERIANDFQNMSPVEK